MDENELVNKLSDALGIEYEKLSKHIGRSIRLMKYGELNYVVFRRDLLGYREGTTILLGEEPLIVHGYPSIQRLAFIEGVSKHMIDNVVVEEKMNGYNVRVVYYMNNIYAITRGGYICPYTTARIRKLYSKNIKLAYQEYPDTILVGEVVGTENPYVIYDYPEARGFDYFIFDTMKKDKLQPLRIRDEIAEKYSLKTVRILDIINKRDIDRLKTIINRLEKERREGVVLKDPYQRVPPLKYTTIYINIRDIWEGMRYPFDEGRGYLFSRIVRLIAQGYEYDWNNTELDRIALKLGRAILEPAINSLKKRANGEIIASKYTLVFPSEDDLSKYIEYAESIGMDFIFRVVEKREDGCIVVELFKMKETHNIYTKMLKTGYSPLD
ncbi:ATP dependent DNA ligase [Staphylothermus marinus F1]|uniref:ATP dependent DNA ligase n=1 Tax=Staphylothermus marinus (strain ATCC 43588 / DSM 3639 / JCM 9404 / F1) TaxID=399550 RepID=A3DPG6_STAMF|nr:RNA ligase [Staphylothermus marinus]ABN70526.1 ATP dependent DNA ligase [Staphylothermus marinus F1]